MNSRPTGSTRFTKVGPARDQRKHHHPGDEEDQVQDKGEGSGANQATLAAHAVHDRDGVDEDIERSRAGPQRDQEPDRDHCRTAT